MKSKSEKLEVRLATILKSIGDAVIATDLKGCITCMNPVAERMTGWKQEEALGRDLTEVFHVVDGFTPPTEVLSTNLLDPQKIDFHHSIVFARDRTETPIDITTTPIRDYKGNMVGNVLVFKDITIYKRLKRRLSWEAAHDPLTKLPNRSLFREALERALARAKKQDSLIAVLFLDLDWFKLVNDNFGHLVGDQLLVAVARRIKSCLRPNAIVGRLGGDEFAVLLEEIKEAGDVKSLAERIKETLKSPFHLAGKEVFVSASIGIALSSNGDDKAEDFLHNADRAMYRVKALNRTECRLCEASVIPRSPVVLESVVDLQRAIDQQEFIIEYQPIISLASGNLTGVEALLRWNHPQRGLLAPREFIPIAEATGLIVPIGEWLLRIVCAQAKAWQSMVAVPVRVAVNVSTRQLLDTEMLRLVEAILKETELTPSLLDLELSEHIAVKDLDLISPVLERLNRIGIRISMDDFGIGYSSLNRLKRLPISSLKIDQSFIQDINSGLDNATLTAAIIAMGHCLKLNVVAEGVEKKEQLAFLRSQECDEIQGYLLSHPMSATKLTKQLRRSSLNNFSSAADFIQPPQFSSSDQS